MLTQYAHAVFQRRVGLTIFCTFRGKTAGKLTVWIVGAPDKRPVTAQFQPQTACAAGGAVAWIRPIWPWREEERPQIFIECVQHIGNGQFLRALNRL